jgi:hypothetical protein
MSTQTSSFTFVAKVTIPEGYDPMEALEYAFQQTNTIDNPWWENKGVRMSHTLTSARSTSVGDRIQFPETAEFWECKGSGWEKV